MRLSKKLMGFVVVGALAGLAGCGGGSGQSDGSTDTAASTSGDRARNVEAGGWGTDKSGVSSVHLQTAVRTEFGVRTFQRPGGDMFTVTNVTRYEGETPKHVIRVEGLVGGGKHVMTDFGTDGHVVLNPDLSSRGWIGPLDTTIVSRNLLVATYRNAEAEDYAVGAIAFFDLRTGQLDTTYGDGGVTKVQPWLCSCTITSVAFRAVDEEGRPQFVVGGPHYAADGSVDDVRVAGMSAGGVLMADIHSPGRVYLSLAAYMPTTANASVNDVVLADPGASGIDNAIGIALTVSTEAGDAMSEISGDSVTAITVAGTESRGLGFPSGMNAYEVPLGLYGVLIANAVLDFSGALGLAIHVSGSTDPRYGPINDKHFIVRVKGGDPSPNVTALEQPSLSEGSKLYSLGNFVADVSLATSAFSASVYDDYAAMQHVVRICFSVTNCTGEDELLVSVYDIDPVEVNSTELEGLSVDNSGLNVVLSNRNYNTRVSNLAALPFDPNGSPTTNKPASLPGEFSVNRWIDKVIAGETFSDNELWVTSAVPVDATHVLAVGSNRPDGYPNFIRQSSTDEVVKDVPIVVPSPIEGFDSSPRRILPLDRHTVLLSADVYDSNELQSRVYSFNPSDGTVDSNFGTNGYTVVPSFVADEDECSGFSQLIAGPKSFTQVIVDYDMVDTGDMPSCSDVPASISWSTYSLTGKLLVPQSGPVVLDQSGIVNVVSYAADALGNLFVVVELRADESEGPSTKHLMKFRPSGHLNTSFGDNGWVDLASEVPGDLAMAYNPSVVVDGADRVYVSSSVYTNGGDIDLIIARFTLAGKLDKVIVPASTTVATTSPTTTAAPTTTIASRGPVAQEIPRLCATVAECEDGPAPARVVNPITVLSDVPVLSAVTPSTNRGVEVGWVRVSSNDKSLVTITSNPGGKTCTSEGTSCIIEGLDPSQAYTFSLKVQGSDAVGGVLPSIAPVKPVVSLRVGRSANVLSFVKPAAKGKATWKVNGGCVLNAAKTKLTAPKTPTTCTLAVTTPKVGSTPKTTRSVTVAVEK